MYTKIYRLTSLTSVWRKIITILVCVLDRQQTREASDSLTVVEKEFRQQQQAMKTVLAEVAELESTNTISGDYELKLQRQGYFITKQTRVTQYIIIIILFYYLFILFTMESQYTSLIRFRSLDLYVHASVCV